LSPASDVLSVHFVEDVAANVTMCHNLKRVDGLLRPVMKHHGFSTEQASAQQLIDDWQHDPHAAVLRVLDEWLPVSDRWSTLGPCRRRATDPGLFGRANDDDLRHGYFEDVAKACRQAGPVRVYDGVGRKAPVPWVVAWPPFLLRTAVLLFERCLAQVSRHAKVREWGKAVHAEVAELLASLKAQEMWNKAEQDYKDLRCFPFDHWDQLGRTLRGLLLQEEDLTAPVALLLDACNNWGCRGLTEVSGELEMRPKQDAARQVVDTLQFIAQQSDKVWLGHEAAVKLFSIFQGELQRAGPLVGELWEFFCFKVLAHSPYILADGNSGACGLPHVPGMRACGDSAPHASLGAGRPSAAAHDAPVPHPVQCADDGRAGRRATAWTCPSHRRAARHPGADDVGDHRRVHTGRGFEHLPAHVPHNLPR